MNMNKLYNYFFPLLVAMTPMLALAQGVNDNSSSFPTSNGNYPRGFMRNMMGGGDYPFYGGHALIWLILMVIFWVLVIGLIVALVRYLFWGLGGYRQHYYHDRYYDSQKTMEEKDDSAAIVKKRYAKGEIDRKEYRELMDELTKR